MLERICRFAGLVTASEHLFAQVCDSVAGLPQKKGISLDVKDILLHVIMHERMKPVRTPVAIFGTLGVCIYVPASRHWLISYSPIHLT